jgi:pyridoxamine--pyruvate transaminase
VTSVKLPDGVDEAVLRKTIRERSGVVISGAQGDLVGKVVRIGHVGLASRSLYPLVGVCALAEGIRELGYSVDIGAAAEATMAELTQPATTAA